MKPMTDNLAHSQAFADLTGKVVVLDLADPYICIGTLVGHDHRYLLLQDADMHDLRDTTTTRDLYALDAKRHGLQPNRRRLLVPHAEVVGISALVDVVD